MEGEAPPRPPLPATYPGYADDSAESSGEDNSGSSCSPSPQRSCFAAVAGTGAVAASSQCTATSPLASNGLPKKPPRPFRTHGSIDCGAPAADSPPFRPHHSPIGENTQCMPAVSCGSSPQSQSDESPSTCTNGLGFQHVPSASSVQSDGSVESSTSDPNRKKPLLPPGYVSHHQQSPARERSSEADSSRSCSTSPSQEPIALATPSSTIGSASKGPCPTGKPMRPAAPNLAALKTRSEAVATSSTPTGAPRTRLESSPSPTAPCGRTSAGSSASSVATPNKPPRRNLCKNQLPARQLPESPPSLQDRSCVSETKIQAAKLDDSKLATSSAPLTPVMSEAEAGSGGGGPTTPPAARGHQPVAAGSTADGQVGGVRTAPPSHGRKSDADRIDEEPTRTTSDGGASKTSGGGGKAGPKCTFESRPPVRVKPFSEVEEPDDGKRSGGKLNLFNKSGSSKGKAGSGRRFYVPKPSHAANAGEATAEETAVASRTYSEDDLTASISSNSSPPQVRADPYGTFPRKASPPKLADFKASSRPSDLKAKGGEMFKNLKKSAASNFRQVKKGFSIDSDEPVIVDSAGNTPSMESTPEESDVPPVNPFRARLRPVTTKQTSIETQGSDDDGESDADSLFQYVIVVSLRKVDGRAGRYEPYVSYSFPPSFGSEAMAKDDGLQSIPAFCFPDIEKWTEPVSTYTSETFSFILTDVSANKRFGYCRRLLSAKSRPCLPEVYCIVSPLGCFSLYSKILDKVEQRNAFSSSAVFAFLKAVIAKPFPAPGRKITVSAFAPQSAGMETITLVRPKDSSWLEHVDFPVLFSKLPYKIILRVFAAMIMERHLIFTAERPSTLSSCILACVALLYPFEWQHVFIPVLPGSLVDICCSPLPYIIGVLKSSLPAITDGDLPIEDDVMIIDLDEGCLVTEVPNDVATLPNKLRSELESSLKDCARNATAQSTALSNTLVDTFTNFFVQTVGHYRKYFKNLDHDWDFDIPAFVKGGSKSSVEFLSAFSKTQMFDVFVQERSDSSRMSSLSKGTFEQTVDTSYGKADGVMASDDRHRGAVKLGKQARKKFKGLMKKI